MPVVLNIAGQVELKQLVDQHKMYFMLWGFDP